MVFKNNIITFAQNYKINLNYPKMITDKLANPKTHLVCDDLTPNQKKLLWEVMARYGALQSFAYDRFFKEGFLAWELKGIDQIKRDFLAEHRGEMFPDGVDADKLPSEEDMISGAGVFYRVLGMTFGMKKVFTEYMNGLGMGSNSVLNKFSTDDWKAYERVGIMAVMEEFEREAVGVE